MQTLPAFLHYRYIANVRLPADNGAAQPAAKQVLLSKSISKSISKTGSKAITQTTGKNRLLAGILLIGGLSSALLSAQPVVAQTTTMPQAQSATVTPGKLQVANKTSGMFLPKGATDMVIADGAVVNKEAINKGLANKKLDNKKIVNIETVNEPIVTDRQQLDRFLPFSYRADLPDLRLDNKDNKLNMLAARAAEPAENASRSEGYYLCFNVANSLFSATDVDNNRSSQSWITAPAVQRCARYDKKFPDNAYIGHMEQLDDSDWILYELICGFTTLERDHPRNVGPNYKRNGHRYNNMCR